MSATSDELAAAVLEEAVKDATDPPVAWLADSPSGDPGDIGPDGATLAELVALRKGERPPQINEPAATTGFYL